MDSRLPKKPLPTKHDAFSSLERHAREVSEVAKLRAKAKALTEENSEQSRLVARMLDDTADMIESLLDTSRGPRAAIH